MPYFSMGLTRLGLIPAESKELLDEIRERYMIVVLRNVEGLKVPCYEVLVRGWQDPRTCLRDAGFMPICPVCGEIDDAVLDRYRNALSQGRDDSIVSFLIREDEVFEPDDVCRGEWIRKSDKKVPVLYARWYATREKAA